MNPSEEFQSKLESGNISEALNFLVSKVVEFKIKTWIATEESDSETTEVKAKVSPNSCLKTTFNLLEGIEHQLGKSILTSESYLEVREYHLSQIDRIDRSVKNNLEILKKIVEILEKNKNTQDLEIPTEKMAIVDRETISSPDLETDLTTNGNDKGKKVISQTNRNSVIFLADDNLITNGNFNQYDNIDLPPQTRKKLQQEDWGDWLEFTDEDIGETSIDSDSNNAENKDEYVNDN
jgi:hypothetical protein